MEDNSLSKLKIYGIVSILLLITTLISIGVAYSIIQTPESVTSEIAEIDLAVNQLDGVYSTLNIEKNNFEENYDNIQSLYEKLEYSYNELKDSNSQNNNNIVSLENQILELEAQNLDLQNQINALEVQLK